MKEKILAFVLALVLVVGYSTVGMADIITVDTENASREELKEAISALNIVLSSKTTENETLPQVLVYSNGMTITLENYEVNDGAIDVFFTFTHQYDQPVNWLMNVICKAYQNGVELDVNIHGGGADTASKTILAGGELPVKQSFNLNDDSDVTICVFPNMSLTNWVNEYQYVKLVID